MLARYRCSGDNKIQLADQTNSSCCCPLGVLRTMAGVLIRQRGWGADVCLHCWGVSYSMKPEVIPFGPWSGSAPGNWCRIQVWGYNCSQLFRPAPTRTMRWRLFYGDPITAVVFLKKKKTQQQTATFTENIETLAHANGLDACYGKEAEETISLKPERYDSSKKR